MRMYVFGALVGKCDHQPVVFRSGADIVEFDVRCAEQTAGHPQPCLFAVVEPSGFVAVETGLQVAVALDVVAVESNFAVRPGFRVGNGIAVEHRNQRILVVVVERTGADSVEGTQREVKFFVCRRAFRVDVVSGKIPVAADHGAAGNVVQKPVTCQCGDFHHVGSVVGHKDGSVPDARR